MIMLYDRLIQMPLKCLCFFFIVSSFNGFDVKRQWLSENLVVMRVYKFHHYHHMHIKYPTPTLQTLGQFSFVNFVNTTAAAISKS